MSIQSQFLMICAVALTAVVGIVGALIRRRNMQLWLWSYVIDLLTRRAPSPEHDVHVYFALADHFEPRRGNVSDSVASSRVERWVREYPDCARRHTDSDGQHPKHTFFYPVEEYGEELVGCLCSLRDMNLADIEIHIHHDNDSAENLRRTILDFSHKLHEKHRLLRRDPGAPHPEYAFIHGNWALDNSRPDGRWCGVDNEISVLVETGCYMDLTMPSAPSNTQTSTVNSVYFARGRPGARKSHDKGRPARVGEWRREGELLCVQGPLCLNWRERKWGILPKIESGELSADAPPSTHRVKLWLSCAVSLIGAGNHVFIKLHTHGAQEENTEMLLSGGFDTLWTELERQVRGRPGYYLHYVTAREMYDVMARLSVGAPQEHHDGR